MSPLNPSLLLLSAFIHQEQAGGALELPHPLHKGKGHGTPADQEGNKCKAVTPQLVHKSRQMVPNKIHI